MKHLKKECEQIRKNYRDLEVSVLNRLREIIISQNKPIPVSIFDYKELGIVNDRLTFFDQNGYHYSLFAEATLEDLIELLNSYVNQ